MMANSRGWNVSQQMKNILDNYTDEVVNAVSDVISDIAKEGRDKLKETSPKRKSKGGGKYARNWRINEFKGRTYKEVEIYNQNHYQLTHLLENGHANRNGGRTNAIVHIEPVNELVQEQAEEKIKEAIERIR